MDVDYLLKKTEMSLYRLVHGVPRWVDRPLTIQLDTHNFCNLFDPKTGRGRICCNPQGVVGYDRKS